MSAQAAVNVIVKPINIRLNVSGARGPIGLTLGAPLADFAGKFVTIGPGRVAYPASGTGADAGLRDDLNNKVTGPYLVAYQERSVGDRLDDTLHLRDKRYAVETDDTGAMQRCQTQINAGGVRKLVIPANDDITLDSAAISNSAFTFTRDVEIEMYGATITLTGTATTVAIFQALNCGFRLRGGKLIGNNKGSSSGHGSAIVSLVNGAAAADATRFDVTDTEFEGFTAQYWVLGVCANSSYALRNVRLKDLNFVSNEDSTISPELLGQRTAFIGLQGQVGPTDGGAGVRNVLVKGIRGDANYIKTGVYFSEKIVGGRIEDCHIENAGLIGANDNCGAYAFALYDSAQLGMSDIQVIGCTAAVFRSVGLYVAGYITRLTIRNLRGWDQTDTVNASLPKGLLCLNGPVDFSVDGVFGDNLAADGVFFVPFDIFTRGIINNIQIVGCANVVKAVSQFGTTNGLKVTNVFGREFSDGGIFVIFSPASPGNAISWVFDGFDLETTIEGAAPIHLFGDEAFSNIRFSNGRLKAPTYGVQMPGITQGRVMLRGITMDGPFSTAGLFATNSTLLDIDDITFNDQDASGYCLNLANAEGAVGMGIRFNNCQDGHLIVVTGNDLCRNTPTFVASRGTFVRKLDAIAGEYLGWQNVDGATQWDRFGTAAL